MLKKVLAMVLVSSSLVACASWFGGGSSAPDSPTVGSKDSSDFLFGQAASAPGASSPTKSSAKPALQVPPANPQPQPMNASGTL